MNLLSNCIRSEAWASIQLVGTSASGCSSSPPTTKVQVAEYIESIPDSDDDGEDSPDDSDDDDDDDDDDHDWLHNDEAKRPVPLPSAEH